MELATETKTANCTGGHRQARISAVSEQWQDCTYHEEECYQTICTICGEVLYRDCGEEQ